jgi:excinuclease ABC subunit C
LLQAVRDEAHRFAITYHRSLRSKQQTASILDSIEGVGKTRKKQLINKFGSINKIKKCTIYDLMRIPGITETIAQNILKTLNK